MSISHSSTRGYRIINLETGELRSLLCAQGGLAVHPTRPVAAVVIDQRLSILDLESSEITHVSNENVGAGNQPMLWSEDGATIGVLVRSGIAGDESRIALYDAADFSLRASFPATSACLVPGTSNLLVYEKASQQLSFIDMGTIEVFRTGNLDGIGAGSPVITCNGQRIAATSPDDQSVMLWDVETLNRVAVFSNEGYVSDLSWSPDGERLLATWGSSIHILDASTVGGACQPSIGTTARSSGTAFKRIRIWKHHGQ